MSNLFAALHAAGNALEAFERSINVTQNNVNNASTPGYARQGSTLEATAFNEFGGLMGGVRFTGTTNGRDEFAEQAVRSQVEAWGKASQQLSNLSDIEAQFDINGNSGIGTAMSQLLQSFSAWSADPNGTSARQAVIAAANALGVSFQQVSSQLSKITRAVDGDLTSTVGEINRIAGDIRDYNVAKLNGGGSDPSLDAKLHNSLESLSELVDVVPLFQDDGTVTVLTGGQAPLVIGANVNALRLGTQSTENPAFPNAIPNATVLDANGADISGIISGGRLAGLLTVRNQTLPSLQGSPNQLGSLNELAKTFADRVNQILTSATGGVALFTYDAAHPTNTAGTLAVVGSLTSGALVAADTGSPNGIALQLAGLGSSSAPADQINGQGFLDYFGNLASGIGQQVASAKNASDSGALTLAQARTFRSEQSGVSLDQEALRLMELQRSYQANAHMVTIISDLTQTVLDMLR